MALSFLCVTWAVFLATSTNCAGNTITHFWCYLTIDTRKDKNLTSLKVDKLTQVDKLKFIFRCGSISMALDFFIYISAVILSSLEQHFKSLNFSYVTNSGCCISIGKVSRENRRKSGMQKWDNQQHNHIAYIYKPSKFTFTYWVSRSKFCHELIIPNKVIRINHFFAERQSF